MAGNNRTSTELQERDLGLFRWLEDMRVITREQAKATVGFRSTRRANDRLLKLYRAGYLKRAFVGRREAVYWLPNRPLQDNARRDNDSSVEPAGIFLRHQLAINQVRLVIEYSGIPVRPWRFVSWQSFIKPLSSTMPLIPDGYFELASTEGSRCVFVEVDLGTEAVPILVRKANLYLQLATSGEFSQKFGRNQFRVIVVTTSPRRLENIRRATAAVTDKIFWFATLDVISPKKFWTNCWLRPTGEQSQSLL